MSKTWSSGLRLVEPTLRPGSGLGESIGVMEYCNKRENNKKWLGPLVSISSMLQHYLYQNQLKIMSWVTLEVHFC